MQILSPSLLEKINYLQNNIDANLQLILNGEWKSASENHRLNIRKAMQDKFSSNFSIQQLTELNNLNWLPECNLGYFSISHCKSIGGFSFSIFKHGFDVEEINRISVSVLKRTCCESEFTNSPRPEFLWVAKEASLKAHSNRHSYKKTKDTSRDTDLTDTDLAHTDYVISDFITTNWLSVAEPKIFSFQILQKKNLEFKINKGYVFTENHNLFCIYFR